MRPAARRRSLPKAAVSELADIFDHRLTDIFDDLSPAQYAFLSGVLAILSEHGEEALTKSCQMVIDRFGRPHAG